MLRPKNTKFKKFQKRFLNRKNLKAIPFLEKSRDDKFSVKARQYRHFTDQQIGAIQQTITRMVKRKTRVELKIFPQISVTKKPLEVRMGKGKGAVSFWTTFVVPGSVIFEGHSKKLNSFEYELKSSFNKLPFRVVFQNTK